MYSEKVMDHFSNPRNVGEIENPDGVGEVGNPVCGDMMTFHVKVKDGRLEDVKFRTFGCGAAIAVSSMVSEMAKGKTVEEALAISNRNVAEELGGLPKHKLHCSNLGADALHMAIEDYLGNAGGAVKTAAAEAAKKARPAAGGDHASADEHHHKCKCPYCDAELPEGTPFCEPCGLDVSFCESCGEALPAGKDVCEACESKAG
jgi:nitrogen fixation NifU-like protein